ncbi:MAG: hypothetical protein ACKOJF_02000, partial [Planctomycetaceae bacterium]
LLTGPGQRATSRRVSDHEDPHLVARFSSRTGRWGDGIHQLQTQGRLMLALDAASAAIPWEMLTTITGPLNDTDGNDSQAAFLAVGRAMVRQFVNSIAPAASPAAEPGHKVRILVVADPAAGRS